MQTEVNVCTNALARIAPMTGASEALAAFAYVLGEVALLNNETEQATHQYTKAVELLAPLGTPYDLAQAQWRAGIAYIAAGDPRSAIDHLFASYRAARRLNAKWLVEETAQLLLSLGEKVDARLGRRTTEQLRRGGLTRRQFEVLQLVAEGFTNQEIGNQFILSTRTVDMHVSNILKRLDCRSRAEAVRKAAELGLFHSVSK